MHALQHFQVDSKEVVSNLSTCVQTILAFTLNHRWAKKVTWSVVPPKSTVFGCCCERTVRMFRDDLGLALLTVPPASEAGREITLTDLPDLMSAHTSTHNDIWQWGSVSPRRRKIAQCSKATKPKSLTCP